MKRFGLSRSALVATLFVAIALRAEEAAPAPKPAVVAAMPAPPATAHKPAGSPQMEELLKRFDTNGDGRLDDDERAAAHDAMLQEQMERRATATAANPRSAQEVRARMLEMFDKDHDGRLDDEERAAMEKYVREQREKGAARMREEIMRRFDKNRDGKIDDSEWTDLEKVARERIAANPAQLARYDKNGDGKLDDTEWAAARGAILHWLNDGDDASAVTMGPLRTPGRAGVEKSAPAAK